MTYPPDPTGSTPGSQPDDGSWEPNDSSSADSTRAYDSYDPQYQAAAGIGSGDGRGGYGGGDNGLNSDGYGDGDDDNGGQDSGGLTKVLFVLAAILMILALIAAAVWALNRGDDDTETAQTTTNSMPTTSVSTPQSLPQTSSVIPPPPPEPASGEMPAPIDPAEGDPNAPAVPGPADADTIGDPSIPVPITVEVTGVGANAIFITVNEDGNVNQEEITLPFVTTRDRIGTAFAYSVAAAPDAGGQPQSPITCKVTGPNGQVWAENTATGDAPIAICAGVIQR